MVPFAGEFVSKFTSRGSKAYSRGVLEIIQVQCQIIVLCVDYILFNFFYFATFFGPCAGPWNGRINRSVVIVFSLRGLVVPITRFVWLYQSRDWVGRSCPK